MGGDGAYGESKAALDALVGRWSAERTWAERVTLAHALIGWVRGTGLMGHNDPVVDAVEAAGVRTWSTAGDGRPSCSKLCTRKAREQAAAGAGRRPTSPVASATPTWTCRGMMKEHAAQAAEAAADAVAEAVATILALPAPPTLAPETVTPRLGRPRRRPGRHGRHRRCR